MTEGDLRCPRCRCRRARGPDRARRRAGVGVRDRYRRCSSRSINRHLADTLWLRRAHSVGARRQLLNLITSAMGVNAMSMHVHRQGLAPPVAA